MKDLFLFLFLFSFLACNGQTTIPTNSNKIVGGPFENRELTYIGMPQQIPSVDTSKAWNGEGQKLLITGKILQQDGKTPAPNIILYYYHTDVHGLYSPSNDLDKRALRHGYIRGWVKSDAKGNYSIYTIRPGAYPNRTDPAHIHVTVKEPKLNEYWIDNFVFDDDPLLTTGKRKALQNRGGSGVLRLLQKGEIQVAEHNIRLGLNIPNYSFEERTNLQSGRKIGEDIFSFTPYHAWGADKGTTVCPVCKYGRYHGILYFVGNYPDWKDIKKWLKFLEKEGVNRKQFLKVYFIYGNEKDFNHAERINSLVSVGEELNLKEIALTFVPSFQNEESKIHLNKINEEVDNTIIIYRQSNVIEKFVNLKPTPNNFETITKCLENTQGKFFDLSPISIE